MRTVRAVVVFQLRRLREAFFGGRGIYTDTSFNYEQYLELQKRKSRDPLRRKLWLEEEWSPKVHLFQAYFSDLFTERTVPGNALCVGARTGQEVQALRNLGVGAVGVDLISQPPLVEEGDMHDLRWNDSTFDFVFSNCFDHSIYPKIFVSEMERVTKSGGLIDLHLQMSKRDDEFGVTDVFRPQAVEELFSNSTLVTSSKIRTLLSMNYRILALRE